MKNSGLTLKFRMTLSVAGVGGQKELSRPLLQAGNADLTCGHGSSVSVVLTLKVVVMRATLMVSMCRKVCCGWLVLNDGVSSWCRIQVTSVSVMSRRIPVAMFRLQFAASNRVVALRCAHVPVVLSMVRSVIETSVARLKWAIVACRALGRVHVLLCCRLRTVSMTRLFSYMIVVVMRAILVASVSVRLLRLELRLVRVGNAVLTIVRVV